MGQNDFFFLKFEFNKDKSSPGYQLKLVIFQAARSSRMQEIQLGRT